MAADTRRRAGFEPELRKNIVTREWVIIARGRGQRPMEIARAEGEAERLPEWEESCPFCPGNEEMTPPEVFAVRDGGPANSPGWQVRVVPNKYPALHAAGSERLRHAGIHAARDGVGAHEVIIESPRHDLDLWEMELTQVEAVIEAYRQRYLACESSEPLRYVLIFRNHGAKAGTSLAHPHSQLIAAPITPHQLAEELRGAADYWEYLGRCVFCALIEEESRSGERTVLESPHFLVVTAYAARYAYETWILPKRHSIRFADMSEEEASDLARVLRETLGRIAATLGRPSYNFAIHTAPAAEHNIRAYHWHIELFPRLTTPGGFELGSDIYINIAEPEEAARYLRQAEVPV